jgi:hypothetical protein
MSENCATLFFFTMYRQMNGLWFADGAVESKKFECHRLAVSPLTPVW